jgi:hypothetical protein
MLKKIFLSLLLVIIIYSLFSFVEYFHDKQEVKKCDRARDEYWIENKDKKVIDISQPSWVYCYSKYSKTYFDIFLRRPMRVIPQ